MVTFEEGSIFEYCENTYSELEKKDGGYYPSKHDSYVFAHAANYFQMPKNEIKRIYNAYSKQAADYEMEKIKRLPPVMQQRIIKEKAADILKNNRDLPYFKLEGPPSHALDSALDVLSEAYRPLVETIAQLGWTIPLNIDIVHFQKLSLVFNDAEKVNDFFENFYDACKFRQICRLITKNIANQAQKHNFQECITAYESGLFGVCQIALITILEGLVSNFGDNPKSVRLMRICNYNSGKEREKKHNIRSLCWLSMYKFIELLFQKSDFSQPEPSSINRHWIQHGRTEKDAKKIDCIRLFNAISTMIVVQNANE